MAEQAVTCPQCANTFTPPLTRFLPFTEEQYKQIIQTYGEDFQVCPKCSKVFNSSGRRQGTSGCAIAILAFASALIATACIAIRLQ